MMIENAVRNWEKRAYMMESINGDAWLLSMQMVDFLKGLNSRKENGDLIYWSTNFGNVVNGYLSGFSLYDGYNYNMVYTTTLDLHYMEIGSLGLSEFNDFVTEKFYEKYM